MKKIDKKLNHFMMQLKKSRFFCLARALELGLTTLHTCDKVGAGKKIHKVRPNSGLNRAGAGV